MDQVVLRNVTKRFTTKTLGDIVAVDNFNLSVHEGECFSFLGPSFNTNLLSIFCVSCFVLGMEVEAMKTLVREKSLFP